MRVLVTGATGFTGGHLARALASRGESVRALVRNPTPASNLSTPDLKVGPTVGSIGAPVGPTFRSGVVGPVPPDGIDVVEGDLTDEASLGRAVAGIEVVYHIAAIYRQAGLPEDRYRAVNARAVGSLIEAAARAGVRRVVHCSTVGVHGDVEHPPANEDAPLKPGDVYQETKLEGERVARVAAARTGVEVVIARPTGIYGPGDRRLLKLFRGIARRRFVILGDGRIFYHLTFIDDLVEGFRLCGTVAPAAGRTYILAGPEVTTLEELVRIVADEAGVPAPRWRLPVWPVWIAGAACEALCAPFGIEPPLYRRRVDFFTKSRAFDIGRARAELGYAPTVGVRAGVRRTLAWYREHGWV